MTAETGLRALVVDGIDIERQIIAQFLYNLNFEIVEATNGQDVMNRVLSGETFDLITMDRSMPIMDGITATWRLREMGGNYKIIALTWDGEFKNAFMEAGADLFLTKPFDPKELVEALKQLALIP